MHFSCGKKISKLNTLTSNYNSHWGFAEIYHYLLILCKIMKVGSHLKLKLIQFLLLYMANIVNSTKDLN